jgi:hypothetical protein
MRRSFSRTPGSRLASLYGYKPALERLDAFLERTNPDFEDAKIKKVCLLLFGERPSITDFSDPPGGPDLPEPESPEPESALPFHNS